jgi:hypothetical protein
MSIGAKRKRTRLEIQRERQALQARLEHRRALTRARMQRLRERLRATEYVEIEDDETAPA